MSKLVFSQESRSKAYQVMNEMGFAGNSGNIGFTSFTVQKNVGLEDFEIYEKELNGESPDYSIVGYSSYHSEETIREQYESRGEKWSKS